MNLIVNYCASSDYFTLHESSGPLTRFHGSWLTGEAIADRTRELFLWVLRLWRHYRPAWFARAHISRRYSIRQPCWSHRRRHSITSKSRQGYAA